MILVHPFQTAAERPPVRIALFGVSNGHGHTQYICGVRFKEGFLEYLLLWRGAFLVKYPLQKCFLELFVFAESFFGCCCCLVSFVEGVCGVPFADGVCCVPFAERFFVEHALVWIVGTFCGQRLCGVAFAEGFSWSTFYDFCVLQWAI